MITANKPAMEYYLASLVLQHSTLRSGSDFVFYIFNSNDEVTYDSFLGRGETLRTYQEIVHERPLTKFEDYIKTVRKKTMVNTRYSVGLLATLDVITSNKSRKTIPIIQVENGRKTGFREAPLCDYAGAFHPNVKTVSMLSGQLQQVYNTGGPKFTVNKTTLLEALRNVKYGPEVAILEKNILIYPEVFR